MQPPPHPPLASVSLPAPLVADELVEFGLWSPQLCDAPRTPCGSYDMEPAYDQRARTCEFLIRCGLHVEIRTPRAFRVRLAPRDPRRLDVYYAGHWVFAFDGKPCREGVLPPIAMSAAGLAALLREILTGRPRDAARLVDRTSG